MNRQLNPEILVDGLIHPEAPRWFDDRLWLSDMHAHRMVTVDLAGRVQQVADLDDKPSGIGFLRDGTPIVVSMRKRMLLRIGPDGGLSTYADLTVVPGDFLNELVMDGQERAYVGNRISRGHRAEDMVATKDHSPEGIILVSSGGWVTAVADNLWGPNGSAISPDNRTLVVAESRGRRLIAFDIEADGSLSNRRVFADTAPANPDGIALDAEGAIWFGAPTTGSFFRMREGGEITDEIKLDDGKWAVACTLGGPDRRTLFMVTGWNTMENLARLKDFESDKLSTSRGLVEVVTVDVPGAGWP